MTRKRTFVVILGTALLAALIIPSLAISQDQDRRDRPERPDGDDPGHITQMMHMVRTIREMCFDESAVAMIAIGALKDEVGRKPKEVIKDFEARLDETKTLGLRNAIRLTLKDLYAETDNKDKMIEHLNALVVENDKALNKKK